MRILKDLHVYYLMLSVLSSPPLVSCLLHQVQCPLLIHLFSFCMYIDHVPLPWTITIGQSLNTLSQCKTVYNTTLKFCISLRPSKLCGNSAKIFCETRIKPCLLGSRKFSLLNWSDSVSQGFIHVKRTLLHLWRRGRRPQDSMLELTNVQLV